MVIKLLEGTQGIGVVLGDTIKSAKSVIEAFQGANVNILVQEFIKEADGADIRALVIGDRVVAAMQRQGAPGEFRSNLHRGGAGEKVKITPAGTSHRGHGRAPRLVSMFAASTCSAPRRGPLVVEVNSSPGIEGLEKASASMWPV